jgi:glycosyltransferase involved in cell wall biosynthesis
MENAAYELYTALCAEHDVTLVKWGGSNKWLPIVYFKLLFQALWHGLRHKPDVIYVQDGVMAPLGWVLKKVLARPTVITVHGLEATYKNPVYKVLVTPFIPKQDAVVVGSSATKQVVEEAFSGLKPHHITYGVKDIFYHPDTRDTKLMLIAEETGIPLATLKSHKLLHTSGRLVPRKGVLWFVHNVVPKLLEDGQEVLYLISGNGQDKEAIEAAISEHHLNESVYLLGRVSDNLLHALYNTADIFVMPNIPVAHDMEGFGLVSLEAASCGALVVASKLEGISDAIINGQNGILVEPRDVAAYTKVITRELRERSLSPELVRHFTLTHYSWEETARQYTELMKSLTLK